MNALNQITAYKELVQEMTKRMEELSKYKAECIVLRDEQADHAMKLANKDYLIENQKKVLETTHGALERITKDNEHLKALLIGEWNAV